MILAFLETLAAAFIGSCAGVMFMESYYKRREDEKVSEYEEDQW